LFSREGLFPLRTTIIFYNNSGSWANDFYIIIPVAKADKYVNIRWQCTDALSRKFWVKGKMPVKDSGQYAVVLDFNEEKNMDGWDIDTQNLDEVYKYGPDGTHDWLPADWDNAKSKSVKYSGIMAEESEDADTADADTSMLMASVAGGASPASSDSRKVKVIFEVRNGGWSLWRTTGVVSTQSDENPVWYSEVAPMIMQLRLMVFRNLIIL